jgi:hypothetical protein
MNASLSNAVADIVEKRVEVLKKEFREILGLNSDSERAVACAPALTNILKGLVLLGEKSPVLSGVGSTAIERKGDGYVYGHLRYWTNAQARNPAASPPASSATNSPARSATSLMALPENDVAVGKGGLALDVYILNADEPFGSIPDNACDMSILDRQSKIKLYCRLRYNRQSAEDTAMVRTVSQPIQDLIENEAKALRKALDNMLVVP